MSQKEIRFVVVGAGHMGAMHIKKLHSLGPKVGARVSVIVEPDELRATSLLREFSGPDKPRILSNLGLLSELGTKDYPDAAIVAVPASIHVETANACLAKNLHTLVEKPLGFSALDVEELSRQARAHKCILQVGLLERLTLAKLWGAWKPKPGPWTINAVRSGPFVPRAADVDVIHDLMIHDIDLFVMIDSVYRICSVKNVRAWGRKLRSGLLDYAIVALDFDNGGMARFFASRLSADSSRSWEMTGPDWHASVDFMRRGMKHFTRVGRDMNAFEARESSWTGGDPLSLELEVFVRRVRGEFDSMAKKVDPVFEHFDPQLLLPTPQNVARTHEIIDEILSCIKVLDT
jgi:predicted dehydrogenase